MGETIKLPVLRTPDGIVKTLDQWNVFARRDDCLDRMVPSDLRVILSNLSRDEHEAAIAAACRETWDKAITIADSKAIVGSRFAGALRAARDAGK